MTAVAVRKARIRSLNADRTIAIARRRVLLAMFSLRDAVQLQPMARAIQERGVWPAMDVIPITEVLGARLRAELPRLFRDAYQSAGEHAAEQLRGRIVRKAFDPNQPRVPSGNPEGGQWTDGGIDEQGRWESTRDADGNTLLYHGTTEHFTEFDRDKLQRRDTGDLGRGVYLTTDVEMADRYAFDNVGTFGGTARTLNIKADIRNTFNITDASIAQLRSNGVAFPVSGSETASRRLTTYLREQGYDSVSMGHEIVVFNPAAVHIFHETVLMGDKPRTDPAHERTTNERLRAAGLDPARYSPYSSHVYKAFGPSQTRVVSILKDVSFRTRVLSWGFDVLNPRGLEYLRLHGADRVRQITEETRRALRRQLAIMYEAGTPALEQARRIKTMVGLTEQHAVAVENLRERLTDMGTAPARVESLVSRKIRQLTDLRALNIARTEMITALATGQTEAWRQAADEGLVQRHEVVRVWTTAEDEQTCAICEPMNLQESLGLDGTFETGEGDRVSDPPAHVNCRCSVDMRV